MPRKAKVPVSTLRRGLPQIPINVSNVNLTERERFGSLPERADVYFEGTVTVNSRVMPCEVHLFRVDKDGWQAGHWYVTMDLNQDKDWRKNHTDYRNDFDNILQEQCHECHKDSYVGKALAAAIHPVLVSKGFKLAEGIGDRGGKSPWWLMNVYTDGQGEREVMKGRARMFHYKQRRNIVCPIHGEFVQETEESSL